MPRIDIAEKQKEAAKKESEKSVILTKMVNGVMYFSHKSLAPDEWYEKQDEALAAAQDKKTKAEYRAAGLNEQGQTPEDAAKSEKIKALNKKREGIVKQLQEIDVEIAQVKNPPKAEVKDEAPKAKKKRKRNDSD